MCPTLGVSGEHVQGLDVHLYWPVMKYPSLPIGVVSGGGIVESGLLPLTNRNVAIPLADTRWGAGTPPPWQAVMRSCPLLGCQWKGSGEPRFRSPSCSEEAVLPIFLEEQWQGKSTKTEDLNAIKKFSENNNNFLKIQVLILNYVSYHESGRSHMECKKIICRCQYWDDRDIRLFWQGF